MRHRLCHHTVLACVVMAGAWTHAGAVLAQNVDKADEATFVVMAPNGPVFARVQILVAKMPYRRWVSRQLSFQLDVNRDSELSVQELSGLTDSVRKLAKISDTNSLPQQISGRADATAVRVVDFAEWLQVQIPRVFDLVAQPEPADDAVRLASLLDADLDSRVSQEELEDSCHQLRFRDLDNDETFSISELVPFRDPRSAQAAVTPDVANLPFFHITDETSQENAAARIMRRYGTAGRLQTTVLRTSELPDGESIDEKELKAFLVSPKYHLTMTVKLSDKSGTSDVDTLLQPGSETFCTIAEDKFGRNTLVIDGVRISVVARGGGANNRMVAKGYLGQSFVMADGDRSQSLDEMEFSGMASALQRSGIQADFATLDADDDLQLTRAELFGFLEREQAAIAGRVEVTVEQDGRTMFSLLDQNLDRRLTLREFRSGPDVLKTFDVNGDGQFADTELGTEYVLKIGLGRSDVQRNDSMLTRADSMAMMNSGDAILPDAAQLAGPEWFRRMDRNQDGDVSRREFPGTTGQFRQIDSDHDELISAVEAEQVGTNP